MRRCWIGKRSPVRPIATGKTPPAAAPQITRVASNSSKECVNAPMMLPIPSSARQIRISRGLPNRSATAPSGNCTKAKAIAVDAASVAAVGMLIPSSCAICGSRGSIAREVSPAAKFPIAMIGSRYCMRGFWIAARYPRLFVEGCSSSCFWRPGRMPSTCAAGLRTPLAAPCWARRMALYQGPDASR